MEILRNFKETSIRDDLRNTQDERLANLLKLYNVRAETFSIVNGTSKPVLNSLFEFWNKEHNAKCWIVV